MLLLANSLKIFFFKLLLAISLRPKHVTTLPCKNTSVMCAKIAPIKAQHWQTKRARTKENVIMVDKLVLSQ